jgi:hypothetical protein
LVGIDLLAKETQHSKAQKKHLCMCLFRIFFCFAFHAFSQFPTVFITNVELLQKIKTFYLNNDDLFKFSRKLKTLLVRLDIGKYLLVQGRRRKRKEVHVAARFTQTARHRAGFHVTTTHICSVQQ